MRKFFAGVLLGVFLCVSFFEFIHKTVEVSRMDFCGEMYDVLSKKWSPEIVYRLKVVYKFFAWPVKTIFIYLSDENIEVKDGSLEFSDQLPIWKDPKQVSGYERHWGRE